MAEITIALLFCNTTDTWSQGLERFALSHLLILNSGQEVVSW